MAVRGIPNLLVDEEIPAYRGRYPHFAYKVFSKSPKVCTTPPKDKSLPLKAMMVFQTILSF